MISHVVFRMGRLVTSRPATFPLDYGERSSVIYYPARSMRSLPFIPWLRLIARLTRDFYCLFYGARTANQPLARQCAMCGCCCILPSGLSIALLSTVQYGKLTAVLLLCKKVYCFYQESCKGKVKMYPVHYGASYKRFSLVAKRLWHFNSLSTTGNVFGMSLYVEKCE